MENNKQACMMILAKVMEDPQSSSCPNVSYADITGPVANFNPTGSPFAHPTGQPNTIKSSSAFSSSASLNSSVAGKLYQFNRSCHIDTIVQIIGTETVWLIFSNEKENSLLKKNSKIII